MSRRPGVKQRTVACHVCDAVVGVRDETGTSRRYVTGTLRVHAPGYRGKPHGRSAVECPGSGQPAQVGGGPVDEHY